MRGRQDGRRAVLVAIVVAHLGIVIGHGMVRSAGISLSPAGNLFVLLVIVIGPLLGLSWLPASSSAGPIWLIATMMAAAFLFGFINHYLIASSDHVSHVPDPWRIRFGATAMLLLISEAIGTGVGIWYGMNATARSSTGCSIQSTCYRLKGGGIAALRIVGNPEKLTYIDRQLSPHVTSDSSLGPR